MDTEPEEYTRTFPAPATPTANALLNDWRFYPYILTMSEITGDSGHRTIESPYSITIINDTTKPKGRKTNHQIMFALLIPTPPAITETPAEEK